MVDEFQPSRQQTDLAEVVEMLLDKGIVINADIAVSIGDTQLLGVQIRAAIASFETAAKYGLEFPEGTDMRRVAAAVGEPELAERERPRPPIDPTRGVNVTADQRYVDETRSDDDETGSDGANSSDDGEETFELPDRGSERVGARPDPERPTSGGFDLLSDDGESADGGDEDGGQESDEQPAQQTEGN
ncbi:gas vesicle protein GvpJ [Natrarchaeobius oligotrophus]|uniref:Gas vesicle protein n=1 Tax=Natrarchaeobius chitinivorans TaxID=1679083 RepID=A0A3N6NHD0_NATCH|nr:gas vesicle protein GvpJ [Natrarchaeobius chitinivorans]RQG98492.1 gas vesicle protein [Natrarchaeobius chitinivorans]